MYCCEMDFLFEIYQNLKSINVRTQNNTFIIDSAVFRCKSDCFLLIVKYRLPTPTYATNKSDF